MAIKKYFKMEDMIKYLKHFLKTPIAYERILLNEIIKTLRAYKKLEKENKKLKKEIKELKGRASICKDIKVCILPAQDKIIVKLKKEIAKYKNAIRIEGRIIKLPKDLVLGTPKKKKPRVRLNP